MRKIPSKYENPLDDILIDLADKICPTLEKFNLSANDITTISLIFGLLSIIFLYKGYIWSFVILYILSYFFDCVDGHYARKYDHVSKLGDIYDHAKDIIVAIGLLVVVYVRNRKRCDTKILISVITIFIIFTVLGYAHLGCQEKYYAQNESQTLNLGKALCPGDPKKKMRITRWFGMGTWVLITISCILVLEKTNICK